MSGNDEAEDAVKTLIDVLVTWHEILVDFIFLSWRRQERGSYGVFGPMRSAISFLQSASEAEDVTIRWCGDSTNSCG